MILRKMNLYFQVSITCARTHTHTHTCVCYMHIGSNMWVLFILVGYLNTNLIFSYTNLYFLFHHSTRNNNDLDILWYVNVNTNIFGFKGITRSKLLKCSLLLPILGRLKLRITHLCLKCKLHTKQFSGQILGVFLPRQQENAVGSR